MWVWVCEKEREKEKNNPTHPPDIYPSYLSNKHTHTNSYTQRHTHHVTSVYLSVRDILILINSSWPYIVLYISLSTFNSTKTQHIEQTCKRNTQTHTQRAVSHSSSTCEPYLFSCSDEVTIIRYFNSIHTIAHLKSHTRARSQHLTTRKCPWFVHFYFEQIICLKWRLKNHGHFHMKKNTKLKCSSSRHFNQNNEAINCFDWNVCFSYSVQGVQNY